MVKNEFLEILKDTLSGEIPHNKITENMEYYDEYFTQSLQAGKTDQEVCQELGEPRLIAKTIIETYKVSKDYQHSSGSKQSGMNNSSQFDETDTFTYASDYQQTFNREPNQDQTTGYEYDKQTYYEKERHNGLFQLNWYQKLLAVVVIVVILFVIITVGALAIRLFFSFGLPILLVYIAYKLIISSFHRK